MTYLVVENNVTMTVFFDPISNKIWKNTSLKSGS